jgi:dipeptidyl aminopeptidase/acylaminoacyl peptidase
MLRERRVKMGAAIVEDTSIPCEGVRLIGRLYRPSEESVYPAVAVCHGFPGDTKNMDLAEELALNGVAVLVFYYMGAWGSGGEFRLTNLVPSTSAAVKYLKGLNFVDPDRVGLIALSMGAVPLTKCMSVDPSIKMGILMSPASDLKPWAQEQYLDSIVPIFLKTAEGKLFGWTEEKLRQDVMVAASELNPIETVTEIHAPLMVVLGTNDTVTTPPDTRRLYEAANEPKKLVEIMGADHEFNEHRILLQKAVIEWVSTHL